MINIPKNVKVGAFDYRVVFPYSFSETTERIADISFPVREIRISEKNYHCGDRRVCDEYLFLCFLHEIIHAIDKTNCMELIGRECDKEQLIDAISHGLAQVLLDNNLYECKEEDSVCQRDS